MTPSQEVIDFVFRQVEEKLASRYISDFDHREELVSDCCGPGRPCQHSQKDCCDFTSLGVDAKYRILSQEIPWKGVESWEDYLDGKPAKNPDSFTDRQISAILCNIVAFRKPRERWLENVPGFLTLERNEGTTDFERHQGPADLKLVTPENDFGMER